MTTKHTRTPDIASAKVAYRRLDKTNGHTWFQWNKSCDLCNSVPYSSLVCKAPAYSEDYQLQETYIQTNYMRA
jgi:hypothetical protein